METDLEKNIARMEVKISPEMEDKHWNTFEKQAMYKGNGVYSIADIYSTDTRELFLMFVARREGIKIKN
jgi:hypothetical protein